MPNKIYNGEINVEFTESNSRQSLNSGEEIKTLFGKIKKWFTDLKVVAFSGSYNDLNDAPTSLPANGGNADTVGGLSVSEFKSKIDVLTDDPISPTEGYMWIKK